MTDLPIILTGITLWLVLCAGVFLWAYAKWEKASKPKGGFAELLELSRCYEKMGKIGMTDEECDKAMVLGMRKMALDAKARVEEEMQAKGKIDQESKK